MTNPTQAAQRVLRVQRDLDATSDVYDGSEAAQREQFEDDVIAVAQAALESGRPTRDEIMSACHSLIARAGGLRKAARACGEHTSNFVNIVKGRRAISRAKLRVIQSALK